MNIIRLDEVNSTNLYAKSNIASFDDKTIIVAGRQTSGRGRFNRKWVDLGDGNLFMTIVLKPSNSFSDIYANITQYLSVVLCKILENYGVLPTIKWPNDVLVNEKKIAGILSETVMNGGNFRGLVLGIGVNLNSDSKSVKQIIDKEVTALNIELNKPVNMDEFLNVLLDRFFENYDEFLSKGFDFIFKDYVERCSVINKEISVQVLSEKKSGKVKSISKNGELVLEQNNKELILTMGDIL